MSYEYATYHAHKSPVRSGSVDLIRSDKQLACQLDLFWGASFRLGANSVKGTSWQLVPTD